MSRHIEVYPFGKLAWRTQEIADEWDPIRTRIYNATHFAEYEMVKRGFRKADVYQLDPGKFDNQIKKVFLDGLVYLPILRSKTYSGYGHRHYPTDTIDQNTFVYGGVCRTLEDAIMFHDAGVINLSERIKDWPPDQMNPNGIDHIVTGRLLGYPECDTKFFQDTWLTDGNLDPMFEMALNTKDCFFVDDNSVQVSGVPLLNRMCRYWGFNLIPYFPHSLDCRHSVDFAATFFGIMKEFDSEATLKCLDLLSMPMKWSLQNCIVYVEHPLFIGSSNGYYTEEKKEVNWITIE